MAILMRQLWSSRRFNFYSRLNGLSGGQPQTPTTWDTGHQVAIVARLKDPGCSSARYLSLGRGQVGAVAG